MRNPCSVWGMATLPPTMTAATGMAGSLPTPPIWARCACPRVNPLGFPIFLICNHNMNEFKSIADVISHYREAGELAKSCSSYYMAIEQFGPNESDRVYHLKEVSYMDGKERTVLKEKSIEAIAEKLDVMEKVILSAQLPDHWESSFKTISHDYFPKSIPTLE